MKTKNKVSTFTLFKSIFQFLDKEDRYFAIIGMIFASLSSAATIIGTYFTGKAITHFFLPTIGNPDSFDFNAFIIYSVEIGILFLLYAVFGFLQNKIFVNLSFKTAMRMRKISMEKLLKMPISYFDKQKTGDIISTLVNDINNFSNSVSMLMTQFFSGLTSIILTLIMMTFQSVVLMIVIVLLAILLFSVTIFMLKQARPALINLQNEFGNLNAYVEEMLTNAKVTQVLDRQESAQVKFNSIAHNIYSHALKGDFWQKIFDPWFIFSSNVIVLVTIVLGLVFKTNNWNVYGIDYTKVDYGMMVALISLIFGLTGNIQTILTGLFQVQLGVASATRVLKLTNLNVPVEQTVDIDINKIQGLIEFNNVSFKYNPDSTKYQIKNASFYAKPGQTIAIVGPTGAGKTTIINLLSKFYEYQEGQIKIDNIDLKTISKHDLRDIMAVVLQDSFLFNDTIFNNLKIAKPDATLEEVRHIAKMVSVDDIIMRMKDGYNTIVDNSDTSLSQGEKQLLAIARAILGNKKILVLDEATSNVDSNTEQIIQNTLQNVVMKNKTSIVIAHRLSTIKNANLILVVNDGEIIEKGNHRELMEAKGYYWNLYTSQFN